MAPILFKSKSSDRWSERLTPAGVLDMALRGSEEQWWELYLAASQDANLRRLLSRLLDHADPDLQGGVHLWRSLIRRWDQPAIISTQS